MILIYKQVNILLKMHLIHSLQKMKKKKVKINKLLLYFCLNYYVINSLITYDFTSYYLHDVVSKWLNEFD